MLACTIALILSSPPSSAVTAATPRSPVAAGREERIARIETELARREEREAARRGAKIFARACAACHGARGRGDGPGAEELDPRPRDLGSRRFRFRTTPSGSPPRLEDLERTIREGLPGSAMPAFDELLSAEQISDLTRFIASLQPDAVRSAPPPEPIALHEVPPASPSLVEEGHGLYLVLECWSCHGRDGSGDGPSAATLTDETGRPIRSTDFRHDPLKGGREPEDIVRTVRTGLNGAPMPSYDAAMLFAREDLAALPALGGPTPQEEAALEALRRAAPSRAELERLGEKGRAELRDRRLAALAHYVLSLDRRRGFWFRVFRQEPEREPRRVRGSGTPRVETGASDPWRE